MVPYRPCVKSACLFVTLVAFFTVSAPPVAAQSDAVSPTLFGLHVHDPLTSEPTVPYGSIRLWDAGVGWDQIEPIRGTYRWSTLDSIISAEADAGRSVMYVLGPTPRWAADHRTRLPRNPGDLRNFIRALVNRYGDRISAFQVWNEANLPLFYTGSPDDLADATLMTRDVLRAMGSRAKVVAPSMAVRGGGSPRGRYLSARYLEVLKGHGWPVHAFSVHTYPLASGTPADRVTAVRAFVRELRRAGAPNRPLIETEINYGLEGMGLRSRSIDGGEAQGFIAQTYLDSIRLGLKSTYWYAWTPRPFSVLGVQLNPEALATQQAWNWIHRDLVGSVPRGCTEANSIVTCRFERGSRRFAFAYVSGVGSFPYSPPPDLNISCDMEDVCSPIANEPLMVGTRPIRLESGDGSSDGSVPILDGAIAPK